MKQLEHYVWETSKKLFVKALIIINSNWQLEFHMHIDAFQLVVGTLVVQNPTSKFHQLVIYASKLLNFVEKNYTTTKQKA